MTPCRRLVGILKATAAKAETTAQRQGDFTISRFQR